MFKVEIIEPTRVILKDEETQAYITVAHHEDNEDGLNFIKSLQVGDEIDVLLEKVEYEEEEGVELNPETNPELPIQPNSEEENSDSLPPSEHSAE